MSKINPKEESFENIVKSEDSMSSKVYVIDTNIILTDYLIPFTIKNAHVILPQIVIAELDNKKNYTENKNVSFNARAFSSKIRKLIKEQGGNSFQLNSTARLTILPTNSEQINEDIAHLALDPAKADSTIIATAWRLQEEGEDVTLLTRDTNMWVTSAALGVHVDDYEVKKELQGLYSGVRTIMLEDTDLIDRVYMGEKMLLDEDEFPGLFPNQILVFKAENSKQSSLICLFKGYNKPLIRVKDHKKVDFAGIKPLNKEQGFAFELLADDSIACVSLAGRAGTGKSIVALSYAIESLEQGRFDKIIILKPVVPVGRDLGFLPGTLEEKLLPWMESFKDTLDFIFKNNSDDKDGFKIEEKTYEYLIDSGILEFQPLSFMRGRSIQNTLIICDEVQNCTQHEIKTLMTRAGDGSKVIALGDVEQVDALYLDQFNNGLYHLVERGKDTSLVGHITFIKSHRSDLANWASEHL